MFVGELSGDFYTVYPKLRVDKSPLEMFLQNFFSATIPCRTSPFLATHPLWAVRPLSGTVTSLCTEASMPDNIPNPSTLRFFSKKGGLKISVSGAKRP